MKLGQKVTTKGWWQMNKIRKQELTKLLTDAELPQPINLGRKLTYNQVEALVELLLPAFEDCFVSGTNIGFDVGYEEGWRANES